ncbi:MAG TPA: presqualene diphosphate synthase HpnD [Caulobacteraceae bacterium]
MSLAATPALRAQASGSSFYRAMQLLPPPERAAMFAIYGFCREVDDIADEPGASPEEQRAQLDVWRRAIDSLYGGGPSPRVRDLVEPSRRYGLAKADFLAVIDGMEMDVDGPIRRPTYAALDRYCDRVASAVGRLSVRVFGMADEPGTELAHHLGRALQLTNILRDIDEDAALGRLYLPDEALTAAGIAGDDPALVIADPRLDVAGRWLAAKAREHYRAAVDLMRRRPVGRLRAPRLMAGVYGAILAGMERTGWAPPRARVSLSKPRLAFILLTRGLGR